MAYDATFEIDTIEFPHGKNQIILTIQYVHPPELAGERKPVSIDLSDSRLQGLEHRMRDMLRELAQEVQQQYGQSDPSTFLGETADE